MYIRVYRKYECSGCFVDGVLEYIIQVCHFFVGCTYYIVHIVNVHVYMRLVLVRSPDHIYIPWAARCTTRRGSLNYTIIHTLNAIFYLRIVVAQSDETKFPVLLFLLHTLLIICVVIRNEHH